MGSRWREIGCWSLLVGGPLVAVAGWLNALDAPPRSDVAENSYRLEDAQLAWGPVGELSIPLIEGRSLKRLVFPRGIQFQRGSLRGGCAAATGNLIDDRLSLAQGRIQWGALVIRLDTVKIGPRRDPVHPTARLDQLRAGVRLATRRVASVNVGRAELTPGFLEQLAHRSWPKGRTEARLSDGSAPVSLLEVAWLTGDLPHSRWVRLHGVKLTGSNGDQISAQRIDGQLGDAKWVAHGVTVQRKGRQRFFAELEIDGADGAVYHGSRHRVGWPLTRVPRRPLFRLDELEAPW